MANYYLKLILKRIIQKLATEKLYMKKVWSLRIIGRTFDFYFFFSQGLLVRLGYVSLRHHLESYLAEFMWRKHVACTDVFESLLEAIATFWPPELQM